MSEFPLWTDLIAKESHAQLQEMYPSPIEKGSPAPWMVSENEPLNPRSPILSAGSRVRVPHKGRMVSGKVVRYDADKAHGAHGWPFYVVDVGEYESVRVPIHSIVTESTLIEAPETFAVMAIDDPSPAWKQGYGHTPEQKVVWQMWGLAKNEIGLAAKMARKEHPKATISVENQGGRIIKVFKPGASITEAEMVSRAISSTPGPEMTEAEMTDAQMKRREEIVKSMKDKEADFKDRYGDRWKEVMYATATKQAMSEEEDDTEYQAYFRAQLKKHGYDSPADIPDDKKDEFFNAVDAGYQAKNEGWASQSSHQYGVTAVDTQEDDNQEPAAESDDQEMMSAQLDSLAQKSATLHDILKHVALGDVPAWIQTKVANADKDVSAILDYMKYEESEPVSEAADPMVPLRLQAAMVIAKSLGSVKGSGQMAPDIKVSGGSPESIVNQAIRVWLQGSHTNEGWALGAKMLKLAKQMGIKWDDKLVKSKLAPITLKKLGLDEAEAGAAPSPMEKLRQRQDQEDTAMELRHEREKIAQQQRDTTDKIREKQLKQAETQRKQQQARHVR